MMNFQIGPNTAMATYPLLAHVSLALNRFKDSLEPVIIWPDVKFPKYSLTFSTIPVWSCYSTGNFS